MTYRDAFRYLQSFFDYEREPYPKDEFFKLDRIKVLAALFENPQNDYQTIHIAGTKGKGSVASILSHILAEADFKVGLYTSPHLISLEERLKINNRDIKREALTLLIYELKQKLKKLGPYFKPSFFEVYTMLAFNYFKKKKIDFGIFEVGLGGRFDATNIIKPIVSCITSISYDHTKELGSCLADIAREKAGIIKKNAYCITAPQNKRVLKIIRNRCRLNGTKLFLLGRDFTYNSISHSTKKELFNINGLLDTYRKIGLPLLGEHQLINCTLSVGIAELLISKGYNISTSNIYNGIAKVKWPARCQIIGNKPRIILDCAHNKASANALKSTIKRNFNYNRLILILGISLNKDIGGIVYELEPLANKIILTRAGNPRSAKPEFIKKFFHNGNVIIANSVEEAYNISKVLAGNNDIILVTGSVYLVGEFKKLVKDSGN